MDCNKRQTNNLPFPLYECNAVAPTCYDYPQRNCPFVPPLSTPRCIIMSAQCSTRILTQPVQLLWHITQQLVQCLIHFRGQLVFQAVRDCVSRDVWYTPALALIDVYHTSLLRLQWHLYQEPNSSGYSAPGIGADHAISKVARQRGFIVPCRASMVTDGVGLLD